jgi:hypothetical protein
MRRFLLIGLSFFLVSALAVAAVHALYRIDLRNGASVFSRDLPVHRGSVLLFHLYPGGVLTSVPEEDVVRVQTGAVDAVRRVLQPGDVVVLGPTGGGQAGTAAAGQTVYGAATGAAIPGGVYDPRNPAYGYGSPRVGPNGQPLAMSPGVAVTTGDLARAQSGELPTAQTQVGPNGFPAAPGSVTMIGPDGLPILAPPGAPGSTPPTIGPNGMPTLAAPGTPGSTQPTIGPNGTPTLAPPKGPGI